MGHFRKLARDQFLNRKGTENEILRLWGISKNYENSITWKNHLSNAFWGISWYLPVVWNGPKVNIPTIWSHVITNFKWLFINVQLNFNSLHSLIKKYRDSVRGFLFETSCWADFCTLSGSKLNFEYGSKCPTMSWRHNLEILSTLKHDY